MMINKNGFVKSEALFDSTQDSKFYKKDGIFIYLWWIRYCKLFKYTQWKWLYFIKWKRKNENYNQIMLEKLYKMMILLKIFFIFLVFYILIII